MVELTEEQKKFLDECEEEFKDRYTEKDEEFMKRKLLEPNKPPIVDPWYNAPGHSNNWDRRHQKRHRFYYSPYNKNRDRERPRPSYRSRESHGHYSDGNASHYRAYRE